MHLYLYVVRSLLNMLFLREKYFGLVLEIVHILRARLIRGTKQMLKPTLYICTTLGSQSQVFFVFKNICELCLIVIDSQENRGLVDSHNKMPLYPDSEDTPLDPNIQLYFYVEIRNSNLYLK